MSMLIPAIYPSQLCSSTTSCPQNLRHDLSIIIEEIETLNQILDQSLRSPKQCVFLKGHNAQYCLMVMPEKFKESRVKGEEFGAFHTDLSKAFHCIDHNLLITKLSWEDCSLNVRMITLLAMRMTLLLIPMHKIYIICNF